MILRALAREAGFQMLLGHRGAPQVDVDLDGVDVRRAIGRILEGLPYSIRYEPDGSGHHELALVVVGELAESGRWRKGMALGQWHAKRKRALGAGGANAMAERLSDPDPTVRVRAVASVRPRGPGAERLGRVLLEDPDPRVRGAAADRLGRGSPEVVVPLLIPGLADEQSSVLIAVLDSLSIVGSSALAVELDPLLQHPDPAVRRRAVAVRRVLEERTQEIP
jgi:hypothetical protein